MRTRSFRLFLIIICVVLFGGAIVYSLLHVRYSVYGKLESELTVTRLSLTHEIERDKDGKFRACDRSVLPGKRGSKACPT